ncbi:hypothetical protein [Rhizobium laguerreae]|uniref:hypothetical protein n=1 Tax=Rhizobium laguerreae TaxID=1076926 RepID=UPI001C920BB9|nr:hypothetical protein [Rhizobium laguerreae]MBY3381679.1 hypothetical protein [Rhizobium laguerreae]
MIAITSECIRRIGERLSVWFAQRNGIVEMKKVPKAMGRYTGDALAIMNDRQVIGYFRDLAETGEPRIDMAGASRVNGIVLPKGDKIGRRRRDDGHAEIGAYEHAVTVTRFDDTIRRLPVFHSKARYIHAFLDQCVFDLWLPATSRQTAPA